MLGARIPKHAGPAAGSDDGPLIIMVATIAAAQRASLAVHELGAGVHLVACDGLPEAPRGGWQVYEGDRLVGPPLARTRLALATGGTREAVVFRSALRRPAVMRLADDLGGTLAVGGISSSAGGSIFELTDGLGPDERLRLARFLFETCAGLFQLRGDARFLNSSSPTALRAGRAAGATRPLVVRSPDVTCCMRARWPAGLAAGRRRGC